MVFGASVWVACAVLNVRKLRIVKHQPFLLDNWEVSLPMSVQRKHFSIRNMLPECSSSEKFRTSSRKLMEMLSMNISILRMASFFNTLEESADYLMPLGYNLLHLRKLSAARWSQPLMSYFRLWWTVDCGGSIPSRIRVLDGVLETNDVEHDFYVTAGHADSGFFRPPFHN